MNHETTAPSLRATAVSILRRLADRLASRAAKRPTIEAIKNVCAGLKQPAAQLRYLQRLGVPAGAR